MRHGRNVVVSGLVAMLAVGAAHAQAPSVGRVLRAMQIDGCSPAQRDAIAMHLHRSDDVANALARPLDEAAARVVAGRLATLYHEDGFPAAEVTARLVDGVLHLRVVPGTERKAGPITVRGESPLSQDALTACLGKVGTKEALWQVGEPAAVGAEHAARIERAVVAACEANGRRGARVAATFDTTGDAVGLVVTFAEPGTEVRIQNVVLQGDDEAHAKSSLLGAAFTPGMLATTAAIDGLVRHCLETGRYLRIEPVLPAGQAFDPLVLRATMRPGAETMADVPREDIALLQGFFARLATRTKLPGGRAVQIRGVPLEEDFGFFPKGLDLMVGSNGAQITSEVLAIGEFSAPFVIGLFEEGVFLRFGPQSWHWEPARIGRVSWSIAAQMIESGTAEIRYGFGWGMKERPLFELDVHPGFVAYSLGTGRVLLRREGELVHVDVGPGILELRLDRSGDVQGVALGSSGLGDGFSVQLVDMPSYADSLAAAGAGSGTVREGGQGSAGHSDDDPTITKELAVMVGSLLELEWGAPSEDLAPPQLSSRFGRASGVVRLLCSVVATRSSARGWPLLMTDMLLALEAGKQDAWRAAGRAFERAEHVGPLAWAVAAQVHGLYGRGALVRPMRSRGREQLQLPALQRDLDDLCASVPFLAGVPQRLGATWRALPELRERFAALPAGEAGDRQAFELGIGLLWEHGGRDLLARWLQDE